MNGRTVYPGMTFGVEWPFQPLRFNIYMVLGVSNTQESIESSSWHVYAVGKDVGAAREGDYRAAVRACAGRSAPSGPIAMAVVAIDTRGDDVGYSDQKMMVATASVLYVNGGLDLRAAPSFVDWELNGGGQLVDAVADRMRTIIDARRALGVKADQVPTLRTPDGQKAPFREVPAQADTDELPVAEMPQADDVWYCPECSTGNVGTDERCQGCGLPRGDKPTTNLKAADCTEAVALLEQQSPCTACGCDFPTIQVTCPTCGTDRPF